MLDSYHFEDSWGLFLPNCSIEQKFQGFINDYVPANDDKKGWFFKIILRSLSINTIICKKEIIWWKRYGSRKDKILGGDSCDGVDSNSSSSNVDDEYDKNDLDALIHFNIDKNPIRYR